MSFMSLEKWMQTWQDLESPLDLEDVAKLGGRGECVPCKLRMQKRVRVAVTNHPPPPRHEVAFTS